jgi:site-specific recombinase XerD
LASRIERFLEYKRALGRRYETEDCALRLFNRYLSEHGIDTVEGLTADVLEAFLASRPRDRPRSYNHLLGVVRRLVDWLVVQGDIENAPTLPPPRRTTSRRLPFLFNVETARRLLALAGRLPDDPRARLRGPTYRTIFGLLYGLGLRVGEVTRLSATDIDRERSLLVIRQTKFSKSRLVPYGSQMARFIGLYLAQAEAQRGAPLGTAPVFSFCDGRPINRHSIDRIFRRLIDQLDLIASPGGHAPRVHDLRHSFAVGTLLRWYREGLDPRRRLLHLSTFLGHVQPDSTAVYLTITEELLRQAGCRFEKYAAPVLEGVSP